MRYLLILCLLVMGCTTESRSIEHFKYSDRVQIQYFKDKYGNASDFLRIKYPDGLECANHNPSHGGGISCNWEKFNKGG